MFYQSDCKLEDFSCCYSHHFRPSNIAIIRSQFLLSTFCWRKYLYWIKAIN